MRKTRKLFRRIRTIIVVLVVLVVLAAVGVFLFADRAVKSAVESAGTKTLNVGVNVDRAHASILRGTVDLKNISVANPPGFQGAAFLKLQQVDVAADARSLLTDEVLIKSMRLDKMELFIEQKGLQNNLYEVIKPLREPHQPSGRGLIVDNLEITNVTVHAALPPIPGRPQTVDFTFGPITMTELGRNEKIDVAILISKIVLAVAAGVAEHGGNILPKETVGEISGIVDKAIDIGKIIFGPGGKTPDGQPQDSLGKSVTEGLKDLLGGKKKE